MHYIGPGSVVTIYDSRCKVMEIKDAAYMLVSFDALSDEVNTIRPQKGPDSLLDKGE